MNPDGPPIALDSPAERTYLAEERTFGAWLRTALTMIVTALAIDRFIYGPEPSLEALAFSLLMLAGAVVVIFQAYSRFARACARASVRGVRVPSRSMLLFLFMVLLATVVLAFTLAIQRY